MRIAIITLPFHTNYGGIIQAFALQTILNRLGHKAYVLSIQDWRSHDYSFVEYNYLRLKISVAKVLSGECFQRFKINKFIAKRLCQKFYFEFRNIKEKDFDAFVVGSDQIWRESFIPNVSNVFLDFAKDWDVKRISYAASFGNDEWCYNAIQTKACKDLIQLFDGISVREVSAVTLCRTFLGADAIHVLDPTLLLTKDDYIHLFKLKDKSTKSQMLVYILDETDSINEMVLRVSAEMRLKPFFIYPSRRNKRILPSIKEWLELIYTSDFVITDSFHVSVFSIIFNKPFSVFKNSVSGNTRLESLLGLLSLEKHMLSEDVQIEEAVACCKSMKKPNSEQIIQGLREKSMSFLSNNL